MFFFVATYRNDLISVGGHKKTQTLRPDFMRDRKRKTAFFDLNLSIRKKNYLRPSFMGIGFGSGILLDLVLFADRIIAEPKSNRSILWDMEVCNDLNGVCAFF